MLAASRSGLVPLPVCPDTTRVLFLTEEDLDLLPFFFVLEEDPKPAAAGALELVFFLAYSSNFLRCCCSCW